VHAGQRNLLEPSGGDPLHLRENFGNRQTARQSPRRRDDAIRAGFRAAGLDAQCEGRPACDAWLDSATAAPVTVAETLGGRKLGLDQPGLSVVRNDANDVRQRRDIRRLTRRVAAGDNDPSMRIGAGDPADGLPRALIGRRRDRAGIDDDKVRVFRRCGSSSSPEKRLFEAKRVSLVDPASEGDDGVLHNAFLPMSRRYCIPSKEIFPTPSYARLMA